MISGTSFFILWWIFVALVMLNFVPTCVALVRNHPKRGKLAALNLVSLFSFALWLVLMAWAISGGREDSRVAMFLANEGNQRMLGISIGGMFALSFGSTLMSLGII